MSYFKLLVNSPWPLLVSHGLVFFFLGGVNFLQGGSGLMLVFGLSWLVFIVTLWFTEIVLENSAGAHKGLMGELFRGGMLIFILSEVCFFFGFFWSFFYKSVNPLFLNVDCFSSWPPFKVIDTWGVPFINTLFLVCSGLTLTWSHHMILHSFFTSKWVFFFVNVGFFLTIVLGGVFEYFQFVEYLHNFFGINSLAYGSKFYMLTGFHGFHVLMGLTMLCVVWGRYLCGHFSWAKHNHLLLGAWYWHFVDVVWLFLFVFVYYFFNVAVLF